MATYITVRQSPMYNRLSFEDLIYGTGSCDLITNNETNTRTYCFDGNTSKLMKFFNMNHALDVLSQFNTKYEELRKVDRHSLYREFHIPKHSGGFRKIDAPNEELMSALRELKDIFEVDFGALYHTTAFAYIKKRCTIDAIKRHQANESKWFGKYDLSNFFGSTTPQFVMKMFSIIFPFSEIMKNPVGKTELELALDLCFLDGGLPQGTPISPVITNIFMIPIDHILSNKLRDYNGQKYIYTRYADDFLVSSRYTFSFREIEGLIRDTLESFEAPFMIKPEKTRYGSSNGSNWNLGVMLNKDNKITVGHKKKKQFQNSLHNYIMDKKSGKSWSIEDVHVLDGLRSYYKMVEGDVIDKIIDSVNNKYHVNVVQMMKDDMRS